MSVSDDLLARVRSLLDVRAGVTDRRMFGGVCFMVNGNMALAVRGAHDGGLMVRLEASEVQAVLAEPHVAPMDSMSGARRLATFVVVDPLGLETDDDLARWVDGAANFAASLPPKLAKSP